jgi:hypothetical protein
MYLSVEYIEFGDFKYSFIIETNILYIIEKH